MSEERLNHYKEWIEDNEEIVVDSSIFEELVKEIERLNENNQSMQEEMARTWKKLDEKENIIKEVREYIETIVKNTPSSMRKDYANMLLIDYKKLLEILDKGE